MINIVNNFSDFTQIFILILHPNIDLKNQLTYFARAITIMK